jgi:hypothetical protein
LKKEKVISKQDAHIPFFRIFEKYKSIWKVKNGHFKMSKNEIPRKVLENRIFFFKPFLIYTLAPPFLSTFAPLFLKVDCDSFLRFVTHFCVLPLISLIKVGNFIFLFERKNLYLL